MSEGTGCLTGSSGFGGALVVVAMVVARAVRAVLEKLESLLTEPRASTNKARAAVCGFGGTARSVSDAASLQPATTVNVE